MVELTDADLLLRLNNFEDNFIERKTSADHKDWLKTVVAFANSTPIGYPAVLYIGVKDDGTIEEAVNLDTVQKTFGKKLKDAQPPIFYQTKVLSLRDKPFLAVIVPGSPTRPHFAGPSYIRKGSETVVASELQFDTLIAERQSKVYEILKWKGRTVSANHRAVSQKSTAAPFVPPPTIEDCNSFYVTLRQPLEGKDWLVSYPLREVEISFDHDCARLQLRIIEQ